MRQVCPVLGERVRDLVVGLVARQEGGCILRDKLPVGSRAKAGYLKAGPVRVHMHNGEALADDAAAAEQPLDLQAPALSLHGR